MDDYGRRIVVDWPFERALMETCRALHDEELHIIGRVDVRDHLKRTLRHEFRQYVLLQVCSSQAMLDVLLQDLSAAPLLPVTIGVYELADGESAIVCGEPLAPMARDRAWQVETPALTAVAERESERLARALDRLHRSAAPAAA